MQTLQAIKAPRRDRDRVLTFRRPRKADGAEVWALIKEIEALDDNSMYCNLLQCSHFAGTCALAEEDGRPLGWVSGYIPPETPDTLFIWQVAVHPRARGRGIAKQLVHELLRRPECFEVRHLHSTITRDNAASWGLFRSLAGDLQAPLEDAAHFERDAHFSGAHATEHLVRIGPFERVRLRRAA